MPTYPGTVTIIGGTGPYTISAYAYLPFSAAISGNTVYFTGTAPERTYTGATFTIRDLTGATVTETNTITVNPQVGLSGLSTNVWTVGQADFNGTETISWGTEPFTEWPIRECQLHNLLIRNLGMVPREGVRIDEDRRAGPGRSSVKVLVLVKVHLLAVSRHQLVFAIAFDLFVQLELGADFRQTVKRLTGGRIRRMVGVLVDMDPHPLLVHVCARHLDHLIALASIKPLI